jgi:hypothetical protein
MSFGGNESKRDLGQLRKLTQTNKKVFKVPLVFSKYILDAK